MRTRSNLADDRARARRPGSVVIRRGDGRTAAGAGLVLSARLDADLKGGVTRSPRFLHVTAQGLDLVGRRCVPWGRGLQRAGSGAEGLRVAGGVEIGPYSRSS